MPENEDQRARADSVEDTARLVALVEPTLLAIGLAATQTPEGAERDKAVNRILLTALVAAYKLGGDRVQSIYREVGTHARADVKPNRN